MTLLNQSSALYNVVLALSQGKGISLVPPPILPEAADLY